MSPLRIERLDDRHFPKVAALLGRVFGRRPSPFLLRRKYATPFHGRRLLGFVALDGRRVVGFCGLVPQRFVDGEVSFPVGQLSDLATDRSHRRSGVWRELFGRLRALAKEEGLAATWGFPTGAATAALRATGAAMLPPLDLRVVPTGAVPFARAAFRLPGLSTPFVAAADRLLRPLLADPYSFRNPLLDDGAVAQRYDAELLGFRSFTPNRLLRLGATTAWVSLGRDLRIGSLDAPDAEGATAAIAVLERLARRLGMSQMVLMTSPGSGLGSWIESAFPARPGWEVAVFDSTLPLERFRVQLGDADVF